MTDIKLNKVQAEMLAQMLEWYDYSMSTYWLDDILIDGKKVMKPEILKNMREMVKMGLVEMFRGGFNDNGDMVGGTHYSIVWEKRAEVQRLLNQLKGTDAG